MKNQTKKELQEFNQEAIEIIEFYGAEKVDDLHYTMDSEKLGKLHIVLDQDVSPVYTIYARFEDTEKASKYLNVGYTGKVNSHEWIPEPCLCHIDSLLDNYNQINGIDKHKEYLNA